MADSSTFQFFPRIGAKPMPLAPIQQPPQQTAPMQSAPVQPAPLAPIAPVAAPVDQNDPNYRDPQIIALAKAIRDQETGNKPVAGDSGELASRYQFLPGTWKSGAQKYLGDSNAPLTLENENKVAYAKIKEWKDAGYTPKQIASMWNSGSPTAYQEGKKGVNAQGVKYDVPAYAESVFSKYQKYKPKEAPASTITPTAEGPKTVSGFAGNVLTSGVKAIEGIATALFHPIQTAKTILSGAEGAVQNIGQAITGEKAPVTEQQKTANAIGQYFKNRYGSLDNLKNTMYKDPVGVAIDVSSILDMGGSVIGKLGDVSKIEEISKAGSLIKTAGESVNPLTIPGKAVGMVGKSLIKPLTTGVDASLLAKAEEMGIKLPIEVTTNNQAVKFLAEKARKSVGGGALTDEFKVAQSAVEAKQAEVLDTITPENVLDKQLIGENLGKVFNESLAAEQKLQDANYKRILPKLEGSQTDPSTYVKTLKEVIANERDLVNSGGGSKEFLADLNRKMDGLFGKPLTFKNLKELRTDINSNIKWNSPFTGPQQGILKRLAGSLTEDMEIAAKNADTTGELAKEMAKTTASYKAFRETFLNKYINAVENKTPEKLVDWLTKPNSKTDLQLLKGMILKHPKAQEVLDQIANSSMAQLIEKSTDFKGNFSFQKFSNQLKKWDDSTLQELLSPEQYTNLQVAKSDLSGVRLMQETLKKARDVGNPSGFVNNMIIEGGVAGLLHNPMVFFGAIIGEAALAKFLASESGRNFFLKAGYAPGELNSLVSKIKKASVKVGTPAFEAGRLGQSITPTTSPIASQTQGKQ